MYSSSHGFKEVVVDQPFSGKWMEVDMNFGKYIVQYATYFELLDSFLSWIIYRI